MQRILELLGRGFRGKQKELPCVMRLARGDVRMELLEIQLPCGHTAYAVDLAYRMGNDDDPSYHMGEDEWLPLGFIRDYVLEDAIVLLTQAKECVDGWRNN